MDAAWASTLFDRAGFAPKESRAASLSRDELATRISALVCTDPALFLERYGHSLTAEELGHFDTLAADYEVNWHLRHLRKPAQERAVEIRNRRFRALAELEQIGDFFSDHNMQLRAPQLYYQHVGRFLPAVEQREFTDETLADRLLANYDADKAASARAVAEEADRLEREEEEEEEEEEEDNDEDGENEKMAAHGSHGCATSVVVPDVSAAAPQVALARCSQMTNAAGMPLASSDGCMEAKTSSRQHGAEEDEDTSEAAYLANGFRLLQEEQQAAIASSGDGAAGASSMDTDETSSGAVWRLSRSEHEQQQRARDELLRIMRERFLAGEEHAFYDYSARCDNNPEYDDHQQQSRDAEERWFDDDD